MLVSSQRLYAKTALVFTRRAYTTTSSAAQMSAEVVLTSKAGGVGEIILNRPKALNSLNAPMIERLRETYSAWGTPGSGVNCIVLKGEGPKAFCAGGDVKQVVLDANAGDAASALRFFKSEYEVDHLIGQLPIPHVAVVDGIVMGGGAGVSMHGAFRVATERTLFAMPELAIGLFPDVGMIQTLLRLPGHLGAYLALTGARLKGVELKEAGLATHFVPSHAVGKLEQRLHKLGAAASDLAAVNAALCEAEAEAGPPPPSSGLLEKLPAINRCFGQVGLAQVLQALQEDTLDPGFSSEALQQLLRGSPLSAAVTWEFLRRAAQGHWSLAACLRTDYVLTQHFCSGHGDFAEGVTARLIAKTDTPRWKHASHNQVPQALVDSFFQPLDATDVLDLQLPWQQPSAASRL